MGTTDVTGSGHRLPSRQDTLIARWAAGLPSAPTIVAVGPFENAEHADRLAQAFITARWRCHAPLVLAGTGPLPTCPAAARLILPSSTGLLYRRGDGNGLARAMLRLFTSPAMRHGMGTRAGEVACRERRNPIERAPDREYVNG